MQSCDQLGVLSVRFSYSTFCLSQENTAPSPVHDNVMKINRLQICWGFLINLKFTHPDAPKYIQYLQIQVVLTRFNIDDHALGFA